MVDREFFTGLERSNGTVKKIAKEFENLPMHVLDKFTKDAGYPIWDKTAIRMVPASNGTTVLSRDGGSRTDSCILIPVVLPEGKETNGFISVLLTDGEVQNMRMFYRNDYKAYPFQCSTVANGITKAEEIVAQTMLFDKAIFGYEIFKIVDKRLYNGTCNYGDTTNVERIVDFSAVAGSGNLSAVCYFVNEARRENHCPYPVNECPNSMTGFRGPCDRCLDVCESIFSVSVQRCFETGGGGNAPGGFPSSLPPGGGGTTTTNPNGNCLVGGLIVNGVLPPNPCNNGGGNNTPPLPPTVVAIKTIMGNYLLPNQIAFLTENIAISAAIFNYLEGGVVSAERKQIILEYINRLITDASYRTFELNHRLSGDENVVWWEDNQWLSSAANFSLGAEAPLPKLTAEEKALVAIYPLQAYIISKNVEPAELRASIEYPGNQLNTHADAFRHAFFNAINTRDVPSSVLPTVLNGASIVRLFATAHESEVPQSLILEKQMDLHNNEVGISYCWNCWFTSNDQIAFQLRQKMQNGEMRYIQLPLTSNSVLLPTYQ